MFDIPEDHFDNPFPTTTQDLCRDQAYHLGRERPEQAWISTSWDTWEPNPFYEGPEEPHPEDYPYEEEDEGVDAASDEDPQDFGDAGLDDDSEEVPF